MYKRGDMVSIHTPHSSDDRRLKAYLGICVTSYAKFSYLYRIVFFLLTNYPRLGGTILCRINHQPTNHGNSHRNSRTPVINPIHSNHHSRTTVNLNGNSSSLIHPSNRCINSNRCNHHQGRKARPGSGLSSPSLVYLYLAVLAHLRL